jgi:hypothetical protein
VADALGVASWGLHPRERNRAARRIMDEMNASDTGKTLDADLQRNKAERRDQVLANVAGDIKHWWEKYEQQENARSEAGTV